MKTVLSQFTVHGVRPQTVSKTDINSFPTAVTVETNFLAVQIQEYKNVTGQQIITNEENVVKLYVHEIKKCDQRALVKTENKYFFSRTYATIRKTKIRRLILGCNFIRQLIHLRKVETAHRLQMYKPC